MNRNYKVKNTQSVIIIICIGCVIASLITVSYITLNCFDLPEKPPLSFLIIISCFLLIVSTGLWLLFAGVKRWALTISEEKIVFTPYFGRDKIYYWEEI